MRQLALEDELEITESQLEDLCEPPTSRLVFVGWNARDLEPWASNDVELRGKYAFYCLRVEERCSESVASLLRGADVIVAYDTESRMTLLEQGFEQVLTGLHPLLIANVCPHSPFTWDPDVLCIARGELEDNHIVEACMALRGLSVSIIVLQTRPMEGGSLLVTAFAGGITKRYATESIEKVEAAVQAARAVVALCPEGIALARRLGRPLFIPPLDDETWSVARDLAPNAMYEDWCALRHGLNDCHTYKDKGCEREMSLALANARVALVGEVE